MCKRHHNKIKDCGQKSCSERKNYAWDNVFSQRRGNSDIIIVNADAAQSTLSTGSALSCGISNVVSALNSVLVNPLPASVTTFNTVSNAYITCRTTNAAGSATDVTLLQAVNTALAADPTATGAPFYLAAANFLGYTSSSLLFSANNVNNNGYNNGYNNGFYNNGFNNGFYN